MSKAASSKRPEICLIAPTESLAKRASSIIQHRNLHIPVFVGALDGAVKIARDLVQQGTWLFISRRGTKRVLEQELQVPVVDIPLAASDYIPAIQQAGKLSGRIAFFSAEEISNELRTICYLQGLNAHYYHFSNNASCQKSVAEAEADGMVLGVGGAVSGRYAKQCGLPYIIVESSDSSIEQAIETAMQMYQMHQESERERERLEIQLERYQNILNYTHDAIIAINEKGCIDVTNRIAQQMIGPGRQPYEGQLISHVLPETNMNKVLRTGIAEINQLMNINGTMVSTNRVPIIVNHKIRGVVATFRDIKSLQSAEQQIRIKLHEKGLTAKYHFSDIIGNSAIMRNIKELAAEFADSQFTVMLYGETGTGKEMFAQSIHNKSPRSSGPFVAVNCTAFSKTLLEAELFGYDDGSFTGARKGGKIGLFELAHGGTIFLDEIGELPIEFQAQFLRVIQEKEVRRVGGEAVIPVDIRIIGATNRKLMELVERGEFRRDLYYRLNVLNLEIPALSQRGQDYLLIAEASYIRVAAGYTEAERVNFLSLMKQYQGYLWPGNVRELNNVVERICLLQKRGLAEERIVSALQSMFAAERGIKHEAEASLFDVASLEEAEQQRIQTVLAQNGGNITQTAKQLKISRSTLYRKLKREES